MSKRRAGSKRSLRPRDTWLILTITVLMVLVLLGGHIPFVLLRDRDLVGALDKQGIGTITGIVPPYANMSGDVSDPMVWVKLDGSQYLVAPGAEIARMRAGDPVLVSYKVGRSGKIYISRITRRTDDREVMRGRGTTMRR